MEWKVVTRARFFRDLFYPLCITHCSLMYIYTGWVSDRKVSAAGGALAGSGVFVLLVMIARASLDLFNVPVRRLLSRSVAARLNA